MANRYRHITWNMLDLLQTSNKSCRKKTCFCALTSHYPITIQRFLISGSIKTMQDAITLLGKLEALEAQDDYRNTRQDSETQDANRRPQYNPRGYRTDINRRESIRVQYVRTIRGWIQLWQEASVRFAESTRQKRMLRLWLGEQEGRRRSRMTHDRSLSLNPEARNFEPRTENTKPNFQEQRPPNSDSIDVSND
jgi:hypothetical protein